MGILLARREDPTGVTRILELGGESGSGGQLGGLGVELGSTGGA